MVSSSGLKFYTDHWQCKMISSFNNDDETNFGTLWINICDVSLLSQITPLSSKSGLLKVKSILNLYFCYNFKSFDLFSPEKINEEPLTQSKWFLLHSKVKSSSVLAGNITFYSSLSRQTAHFFGFWLLNTKTSLT